MRTVYEALNGTIFHSKKECQDYEFNHYDYPNLKKIDFYTITGDKHHLDHFSAFDAEHDNHSFLDYVVRVVIHNEKEYGAFRTFIFDKGWYALDDITKPGVWVYNSKKESNSGLWGIS